MAKKEFKNKTIERKIYFYKVVCLVDGKEQNLKEVFDSYINLLDSNYENLEERGLAIPFFDKYHFLDVEAHKRDEKKATNRLLSEIKGRIKSLFSWIAEVKEELSKSETPNLVNMLSDCYSERNAAAYSQRGKTLNLKEYSETVNYLRDNNIFSIEELQSRLSDVNASFNTLSDSLKAKSARMKELQELIRQGENYFCLKPVHDELNGIKWKKQREHLKADHDSELRLFYLARRILREKLSGKPVTVKDWQREYESLKAEYAELSKQHKPLRDELIKLRGVQYHVNRVLSEHTEERRPQAKTHEGR